MRLVLSDVSAQIRKAIKEMERPIAEAATAAVREAGLMAKAEGRANIAAAGFSQKWQNALRCDVYPKNGVSIGAAAHIHHKIPYAGVFEDGATISGDPLLWLPLPGAPIDADLRHGGRKLTPKKYIAQGGRLASVKRPGKRPLLVGKPGAGSDKAVPLYVGVPLVNISKKFNITDAVRRAAARLGEFYLKHLKP